MTGNDLGLVETLELAAPLVLVAVLVVELLACAAIMHRRPTRAPRRLALGGLAVVVVLLLVRQANPALDGGAPLLSGALVVDRLGELLDLAIVFVSIAALALGGDGEGRSRGDAETLIVLACAGSMVVVHSSHLGTAALGLELVSLVGLVLGYRCIGASEDGGDDLGRRDIVRRLALPAFVGSAFLLFGIGLIYVGLASLRVDSLGSHAGVAFNRWAAVQPYVDLVASGDPRIPPGLLAQAQGKAVSGMAPIALFLPGLLMVLIGMMAKLGAAPFPWPGCARPIRGNSALVLIVSLLAGLAVLGLFVRLFVGAFHAPQLVREPYGWSGIVVVLGVLTVGVAGIRAVRASRVLEFAVALWMAHVGLVLVGLAAAAGFYGHRRGLSSLLTSTEELDWSLVTGDGAVAASLVSLVVATVAVVGLVAAGRLGRRGAEEVHLASWAGLGRRRPLAGAAMTVCLGALAGMPLTGGFMARVAMLRSLFQHSSFAIVATIVALEMALLAWACIRIAARLHAAPGPAEAGADSAPRGHGLATATTVAAALLLLIAGFAGDRVLIQCRIAAAGSSMAPGLKARGKWVRDTRERLVGSAAVPPTEPRDEPTSLKP